ncbi:MAG: choice-of-anchor D domain-containing protein [Micromonosporaceae bacterium]|nr:choice-of-anchor D domain-containing protein [Micromonosporaceae bacterium]
MGLRRTGGRPPQWLRIAVAGVLLGGILGAMELRDAPAAHADDTTVSYDAQRTGWDPVEPNLAPSTVVSSNFGQVFSTVLNGQVFAQPLVVGDTVIANTENDFVYGLDSASGAIRWSRSFGPAWPASTIGCANIAPNIGSTATAVYDPATDSVYVSTKVNDGPDPQHPNFYLHALNPATGIERAGWPVRIVGTPVNDPNHPFIAEAVNNRAGLLLLDGSVYLGFGSQCDYLADKYVGYIVGVNTTTAAITMWSDEVGASNRDAGIWMSGGGIVSDGPGRLFVSTGNGVTAPPGPGSSPPGQLSESVVRLAVGSGGVLSAKDYFSPSDAATLDKNDQDLGSGAPVALPSPYFGTATYPHLMSEIGKDGRLFLLDRDHLGGKGQGPGGKDDVLQTLGPYKGVWGHPAAYGGSGGYLYLVQNAGTMLAFHYSTDGTGAPAFSLVGNSAESFGYTSGSPIVTSDGTAVGSAAVWVVSTTGPTGAGGQLCAYNAIPNSGRIPLLRCFPIGTAAKFTVPASAGGRIYVGTLDGRLYGFGQPTGTALATPPTSLGSVPVNTTQAGMVTVTATRTVTVRTVAATAPFGATAPAGLPVTLSAGQTLSVPVTFRPTTPGSFIGALNLGITDNGVTGTFSAGLQGNGIRPGFTAEPATVDFGQITIGSSEALTVSFTNTGATDETITSVTGPTGAFTATGLPAAGSVVAPGQSVAVSVRFAPTGNGAATGTVTVAGPDGAGTATLTGTGVGGQARLAITPATVDFGTIPVGSSASRTLTVANTGNVNLTITKAAAPALPFVVDIPLPEGQVLTPGDSVDVQITFAPSAAGTFTVPYLISSDDGTGAHPVPVTGTAVRPWDGRPLPTITGGWQFNGSAAMDGAALVLTPASANLAGSAIYSMPLPSNGISAQFTAQLAGGTGAEGLTFALVGTATGSPQGLGGGADGLGFAGLPGVAVVLDTHQTGEDPSGNFLGITDGTGGAAIGYAATTSDIPDLRTGTHTVAVTTSGGTLSVTLDGVPRLSAQVPLPSTVYAGFTASTGTGTDRHAVSQVSIRSGDTALPAPGSGWRFNGAAALYASEAVLTPDQPSVAGSVLYSDPVRTDGLRASFTLSMSGGSGATGTTFALLDPARSDPTGVGRVDTGLGLAGLPGVAVAFGTAPVTGTTSSNFVAIVASNGTGLTLLATSTAVPNLRASQHQIGITVFAHRLTVSVDGQSVLSAVVSTLTDTALVGFTAATGTRTDVHRVGAVQITPRSAAPVPPPPRPRPSGLPPVPPPRR